MDPGVSRGTIPVAVGLLALPPSCGGRPERRAPGSGPAAGARGSGAGRRAERLETITGRRDPTRNMFINSSRAEYLRAGIAKRPGQRMSLLPLVADELLKAGRTEEAIATAQSLLHPSSADAIEAPPAVETHEFLGLAYMRLGEQENCVAHHGIDSCLVPIRGSGLHTLPRGARGAIEEFSRLLEEQPGNLGARWLMNIAYMTLGEYPDKVPRKWLIPPSTFASEYDIKRFYDVAPKLGLSISGHAGGAILEDFDGDGLLDIMFSSMGVRDQLRYFHNDGDGSFSDRTEAAGLTGELCGLDNPHAHYHHERQPGVPVPPGGWMRTRGRYPNSLLHNNGDGTFEDFTEEARILSFHPTQTGAWGGYDNDGFVDLFI